MKNKKVLIGILALLVIAALALTSCSKTEEKAKEATAAVEAAVDTAKEEVAEAAEQAGEAVDTAKEEVAEKAEEVVETAKEEVAEAAEQAGEAVDTAKEEVAEKAEEVVETVKEEVAEAAEQVGEAVETAKEEVAGAAEEAAEKVEEGAAAAEEAVEAAKEEVADVAEEAAEKVEEGAAAAEEAVEAAKEEVAAAAEEAGEKAEEAAAAVEETVAEAVEEAGKVMSHDEFVKAELDSTVCIEAYVQASQGWWAKDGVGRKTLYLQSEDGAYFAYEVLMDEAEAEKMVPGTKLRLEGVKAEWSGEVEIIDAKYEILEGSFIAEPTDVTALLGKDELADHINEKITIKGAKVAASKVEGQDEEFAFLYNWDGSGSREGNSDLYFNVEVDGQTYTLTVESYLCGSDTDVYKAVEGLKVGDTIDCEGFLYWYNGANPHITGVTVVTAE